MSESSWRKWAGPIAKAALAGLILGFAYQSKRWVRKRKQNKSLPEEDTSMVKKLEKMTQDQITSQKIFVQLANHIQNMQKNLIRLS